MLLVLVFSKYIYLASLSTYYTFYLIETFHVSVKSAQLHLFVFLGAVAAGTVLGGPVGDRFGRKYVIWGSILGVLPFTLALPFANLAVTGVLSAIIGLILASAFSAILVYAQELVPGNVGMICRALLRPRVRDRWAGRRGARRVGRCDQYHVHLSFVRMAARAGPAHSVAARSRTSWRTRVPWGEIDWTTRRGTSPKSATHPRARGTLQ